MILRPQYDAVKKVALVQYAINPGQVYGTPSDDNVRAEAAEKNAAIFMKEMGNTWQLTQLADLSANAAYTGAGKPTAEHFVTAKGMVFVDENAALRAELSPEVAKKLCADLGVDAVVAVSEQWNIQANFFQGICRNTYWINMFDKDGTKIMSDAVVGTSSQNFGVPPGGAVATEQATWVKASGEAMENGLSALREHINAK